MHPLQSRLVLSLAALALFGSLTAFGGSTVVPSVVSVDTKASTVTINTGASNRIKIDREGPHNQGVYKVNAFTGITVNGLKATLADIKPGMKADVLRGMDRDVAATITAYGTPSAIPKATPTFSGSTKALAQAIEEEQIVSVGKDTITVGQRGTKRLHAYKVDKLTQITLGTKKVELAGLRAGMWVQMHIGSDHLSVAQIVARE